jgi:hypothetical protein
MGGMMAVDRAPGTQVEEEDRIARSVSRIRETLGERAHVNVTSYNRQVLLTGEVPTAADSQSRPDRGGGEQCALGGERSGRDAQHLTGPAFE